MPENSWEPTDTPCLAIKVDTNHEEEEKFNKGRGTDSSQIAAAAVALKQKEEQGSQFFYTGCSTIQRDHIMLTAQKIFYLLVIWDTNFKSTILEPYFLSS